MNENDDTNVETYLDDMFIMCHKALVPKDRIMNEKDVESLRICYIRYIRSYEHITSLAQYFYGSINNPEN